MAQHVVSIAFDFDDERAIKAAEHAVENNLDKFIKDAVLDHIAPYSGGWGRREKERDYEKLDRKVDNAIAEFLNDHKEDIIEKAAEKLSRSTIRSKAWKEKIKEA